MGKRNRPPPPSLPDGMRDLWCELSAGIPERVPDAKVEGLVTAMHRLRDARSRIANEGSVVADARGNPVAHPAIAIEKQAGAEVRAWMKEIR